MRWQRFATLVAMKGMVQRSSHAAGEALAAPFSRLPGPGRQAGDDWRSRGDQGCLALTFVPACAGDEPGLRRGML